MITSALSAWCFAAGAQTNLDFLGFNPVSFERVVSRSHDENMILHFADPAVQSSAAEDAQEEPQKEPESMVPEDDYAEENVQREHDLEEEGHYKTLFYRKFHGKYAAARRKSFSAVLDALSTTGVAPYPVRVGEKEIVVTFVEGDVVNLNNFDSETFLPLVMATLNRFYKALEPIGESLSKRTLLSLAETRVNKIKDKAIKEFLWNLLAQWKKKFLRDLEETTRAVVHGDLHASNMIVKDGRLWLLDYGLCGNGFIIEDLARLSVYSNLSRDDESYMLRYWFEDKYGEELHKLLDACKILAVFLWFLIESQRLPVSAVRSSVFAVDVGEFNEVTFASGVVDVARPPLYRVSRLLGQSVRRLKELCQS